MLDLAIKQSFSFWYNRCDRKAFGLSEVRWMGTDMVTPETPVSDNRASEATRSVGNVGSDTQAQP